MSRFFHGSDSSSESSSEEEELLSGEEGSGEESKSKPKPKPKAAADSSEEESSSEEDDDESDSDESSDEEGATGVNRFLRSDDEDESSAEEEDKVTVVKSAKDKKYEELEGTVRLIENAEKIGDWAVISSEYDKLNRQLPALVKQNDGKPPKLYIKTVADLELIMQEAHEKQKVTPKKMSTVSSKGLNAVRQKIRKLNKDYQTDIEAYREDKDAFMTEDVVEEAPQPSRRPRAQDAIPGGSVEDVDGEGWEGIGRDGRPMKYTAESILKHLRSIVEARGRKNTDRMEQIRIMERLLDVAATDYQKLRVLLSLISTRFDLTSGTTNYMTQEQWRLADQEYKQLLSLLDANRNIVIIEGAEEWEDDEKQPQIETSSIFKIPGSISSLVERLDDELTRSLQHIDPHTAEYIERLTDETKLYTNIKRTLLYCERLIGVSELSFSQDNVNRVVMRRLEHIYFKPSQVVMILEDNSWKEISEKLNSAITPRGQATDTEDLVKTLCAYLFQNSEGIIRARAMLCQIYYLALHDQYYRARDMMLMSHLQETIVNFDVNSQILYNRSLVQIGLCAFRAGLVYEAQNCLQDICGSGRQKELLAQGVQMTRYSQVSPEQERLERQRQFPFHMHINLELLECVYLTCSMLLEIPLLAQTGSSPDIRKRVISKTYRRMLEYHERQIFTGPPENTRDHVMQASKALAAGEWRKAAEFISAIKIWDLMKEPAAIKTMLEAQIQEEGLRTYLFTYAPYYDTVGLSTLADMFSLPERKVGAVVSRMISHEELAAALDQVGQTIVFRKGVELSRLQSLALTLSDKASGLIEQNERVLEQRTQGTANAFERDRGGGGRGGRGGQRGRGGRGGQGFRRGGGFTGGALGNAIKT
ncbi:MAG: Translation initiation factor 3 subunit c [Chrysothrix sp. TS-e1954]|nr:MAG: Translation initiation factor 3 subunit c [Chrysothrix sp. TS-e1954]